MSDFFPFIGLPEDYVTEIDNSLPPLKELAFNINTNEFIVDEKTNDIKVVEKKEALKIWIYKAIFTNRYEHPIYSFNYGVELYKLIGQKFSRGLTESEVFRYIREALMINPYIKDVLNKGITFVNDELHIKIKVESLYGEVDIDVRK